MHYLEWNKIFAYFISMASTRNNNTYGDYCLQQESYANARQYVSYEHSSYGVAQQNAMPCLGITPSHMPRNTLSNNPVEIESALFGIGSVNLVKPKAPVKPELKKIPSISYFETTPLLMPKPLVVPKGQRPWPI